MIHENEKEILSILSEDETGIKEQRIFLKRKKKTNTIQNNLSNSHLKYKSIKLPS